MLKGNKYHISGRQNFMLSGSTNRIKEYKYWRNIKRKRKEEN